VDIAIIGSGISGLAAAWALRHDHDIRIFERDLRPGGHVKTVTVPTAEGPVNVDTGFIVYNEPTYPNLTALFAELEIETQPTEMSLGHACAACGLEFGSRQPASMFAQPGSLARLSHWHMINDIRRFYGAARRRLDNDVWTRDTLADFLDAGRYGNAFRNHFLVPVVSAVWSTSAAEIMDFPVDYLLRFLDNHGLIGFGKGKPWRTVVGGSMTYVDRIIERLPSDALVAGDPVVDVRREEDGVTVTNLSGRNERFDAVVMATHADVSLRLLNDADSSSTPPTTSCSIPMTRSCPTMAARVARGTWRPPTAASLRKSWS
jgi:predicted NAD/FAD-binding protein